MKKWIFLAINIYIIFSAFASSAMHLDYSNKNAYFKLPFKIYLCAFVFSFLTVCASFYISYGLRGFGEKKIPKLNDFIFKNLFTSIYFSGIILFASILGSVIHAVLFFERADLITSMSNISLYISVFGGWAAACVIIFMRWKKSKPQVEHLP